MQLLNNRQAKLNSIPVVTGMKEEENFIVSLNRVIAL